MHQPETQPIALGGAAHCCGAATRDTKVAASRGQTWQGLPCGPSPASDLPSRVVFGSGRLKQQPSRTERAKKDLRESV
eukprot:6322463-Alexandrium_andersonii.AAC.1